MLKINNKKYCKVRDYCHCTDECRGASHSICGLKYSLPKETTIIFHKRQNCNYHFIIKEFEEEIWGQLTCLGESTKKYITFSVSVKTEVKRIAKNDLKITKTIFYKLKFIDSARFMRSSLSKLVNNLTEGVLKIKCKYNIMYR